MYSIKYIDFILNVYLRFVPDSHGVLGRCAVHFKYIYIYNIIAHMFRLPL